MNDRYDSMVDTILSGTWRLERLIGRGGMASVYAGRHCRNGLPVAIKVLRRDFAQNEGLRVRFQREGYIANRIEHPGVVRVIDDGFDQGQAYLVMDLLEGESLGGLWERSGRILPLATVSPLIDQVLQILIAAHALGVVHRDVKPDNVFLGKSGQVHLLDFGIARLREGAEGAQTNTGDLLGTPAFMAPEQASGLWSEVDARSDVFAVAATAFTLLSGRLVHDARTVSALMVVAASTPAPPIQSVLPSLPSPHARVIDRGLAFLPSDRWESAKAMLTAWRDADERVGEGMTVRMSHRDLAADGGATERMQRNDALRELSEAAPFAPVPPTERDPGLEAAAGQPSWPRLMAFALLLAALGVGAAFALVRLLR